MTRRPNIVLIITDQERSHKHWPTGWAEKNLPTYYDRLIGCAGREDRSSVSFPNAFTATTECCPSRASLLTSSYPTEHGVKTTPGSLDPRFDLGLDVVPDNDNNDDGDKKRVRPNLLRLLSELRGYDVGWKGKWHLSHHFSSGSMGESSILKYYGATSNWNPPDAGHSLSHSATLGGGRKYNHDGRFLRGLKKRFENTKNDNNSYDDNDEYESVKKLVDPYHHRKSKYEEDTDDDSNEEEEECIFEFLAKHTLDPINNSQLDLTSSDAQPFFLIASLVNPHDVWASSCFSHLTDDEFYMETGYHPKEFESLPIDLPPNYKDNLSTKPTIHGILHDHFAFGNLSDKIDVSRNQRTQSDALRYIRFYAFLHKIVDAEIGSLLDALDATGQMDNTIIVRMADHGEQALSHGLREKRMQCYEETMGIPLVINYPTGWFSDDNAGQGSNADDNARKTSSKLVSTTLVSSIDVLPTIAEMAGIECSAYHYRGKSLVPCLRNDYQHSDPADSTDEDEILFTFDEPLAPPGIPGFLRCIRTGDLKYAVYFTLDGQIVEYEMYDLSTDPYELLNMCGPPNMMEPDDRWYDCHERLTRLMLKMGAVPSEFDWGDTKPGQKKFDDKDDYDTSLPTIETALSKKNKANELFTEGNYQHAAIHYAKALEDCAFLFDLPPEKEEILREIRLSLYMNLALVHIKLHKLDNAMQNCDDALNLDPTNVKALYRRAIVLYKKRKFDDAERELEVAGRLASEDKSIMKLRYLVNQEILKQTQKEKADIVKQKKKEKAMAHKMFG